MSGEDTAALKRAAMLRYWSGAGRRLEAGKRVKRGWVTRARDTSVLSCGVCGRVCKGRIGLGVHMSRGHRDADAA